MTCTDARDTSRTPLSPLSPARIAPTQGDTATVQSQEASVTDEMKDLPALLPVPKAAAILGISRASAYRYAAAGELPVRRLGGRVYVVTARLRALIDGTDEVAV